MPINHYYGLSLCAYEVMTPILPKRRAVDDPDPASLNSRSVQQKGVSTELRAFLLISNIDVL